MQKGIGKIWFVCCLALMSARLVQAQVQEPLFESAPVPVLATERLMVGAYDPAHSNALSFIAEQFNANRPPTIQSFGLRLLVYRSATPNAPNDATNGILLEDAPPLDRITLLGPLAADGAYARMHWLSPFDRSKSLTLEWARLTARVIVGRVVSRGAIQLALEAYRPFVGNGGTLNLRANDARTLLGEQLGKVSNVAALSHILIRTERDALGTNSYSDPQAFRNWLTRPVVAASGTNPEAAAATTGKPAPNAVGDTLEATDLFAAQAFASLSFALKEKESIGFVVVLGNNFDALEKEAAQVLQKPVSELLAAAETRYEATRPRTDGWLGEAWESLSRTINWNRLYAPTVQHEVASSLRMPQRGNANASETTGWDAFFRAMTATLIEPRHAQESLLALLTDPAADGRVAAQEWLLAAAGSGNANAQARNLSGRSMPPVGALCAWKAYLATRDLQFLASAYVRLKRWHEWWLADRGDGQPWRDGNKDGLLEWGYDAELEVGELTARRIPAQLKAQFAAAESGMPESPQWGLQPLKPSGEGPAEQPVQFDDSTHTLQLTPVGLNALYALDAEMLALMARELALTDDAKRWEAQYVKLRALIDERLWSEADKLYLNRRWDGTFVRRLTPDIFFVLAAGVPAPERAKQMLAALRDPLLFGGEVGLPTLARSDPAFAANERWRGDVAAATSYLVYLGLKHYGFSAEAADIAHKSAALGQAAWMNNGKVFDSFSSEDGSFLRLPAMSANAKKNDPNFGALIWLPALEELVAADPWSGLTLGSETATGSASIQRVLFGGEIYTIQLSAEQLRIERNNEPELEFDKPVHLLGFRTNGRALTFFVETKSGASFAVPSPANRPVSVLVDNKLVVEAGENNKNTRVKLTPGVHRVVVVK